MFDLIKKTIQSGNYKFLELQQRIARLYAMGNISAEELDELMALAVEKTSPDQERPEMLDLVQTLSRKVDALAAEVAALRAGTSGGDASGDPAEYPAWQPWDGLSDKYQPGSVVSHKGQLWESVYPGQNVWEPGTVDERFWKKYNPED